MNGVFHSKVSKKMPSSSFRLRNNRAREEHSPGQYWTGQLLDLNQSVTRTMMNLVLDKLSD